MNTQPRGASFLSIPVSSWMFNDDPRIDVAVTPMAVDWLRIAHKTIPLSMFLSSEVIAKECVGPGDDVCFPGLFSMHPGEVANIPIVRVGNIAAMPAEPIKTKGEGGWLQPPYLVEARSIGGLSGSPVFWHRGAGRVKSGGFHLNQGPLLYLLGLVHGHYAETELPWDSSNDVLLDAAETRSLNTGIAIVVPASDILSTLNQLPLIQHREILRQTVLARKLAELPIPDATQARTSSSHAMSNSAMMDSPGRLIEGNEPPINP
jgi:hypothetical protein